MFICLRSKQTIIEGQTYSFLWTSTQSDPCSIQRVTLRTARTFRGGCGAITTDCPFSLALLAEPHVGHCTTSTLDSNHRAAASRIGPENEQEAVSPSGSAVPTGSRRGEDSPTRLFRLRVFCSTVTS